MTQGRARATTPLPIGGTVSFRTRDGRCTVVLSRPYTRVFEVEVYLGTLRLHGWCRSHPTEARARGFARWVAATVAAPTEFVLAA